MTDNEIIKALECCIKSSHFGECFENECPMASEKGCRVGNETLYPYALDLINRQKEEIEVLSQKRANIFEISAAYERGRTEAIKEFEERVKRYVDVGHLRSPTEKYFSDLDVVRMIGYIAKEQVERKGRCGK